METEELELTDDEKRLVMIYREEKRLPGQRKRAVTHVLRTAADYHEWMMEHGLGDTYSTFCDDFGYEYSGLIDRPQVHQIVMRIINAVQHSVDEQLNQ